MFFEKYIDLMLIKDIKLLIERNNDFKFSYPYILLASSCIDLFGGIEKGFKKDGRSNSKERFMWFITEWMSRINQLYKEESLAYLIYDSWRCGVSHQATLKQGFETSSYEYPKDQHLYYLKDKKRVFVHSIKFAEDMIAAQKLYRIYIKEKAINTAYIDTLYQHLMDMIDDSNPRRTCYFNRFEKLLGKENLVFYSLANTSTTTTVNTSPALVSPSNPPTTRLPEELLPAVPSAAPKDDDLKNKP